jgi:hypothetical protein
MGSRCQTGVESNDHTRQIFKLKLKGLMASEIAILTNTAEAKVERLLRTFK